MTSLINMVSDVGPGKVMVGVGFFAALIIAVLYVTY